MFKPCPTCQRHVETNLLTGARAACPFCSTDAKSPSVLRRTSPLRGAALLAALSAAACGGEAEPAEQPAVTAEGGERVGHDDGDLDEHTTETPDQDGDLDERTSETSDQDGDLDERTSETSDQDGDLDETQDDDEPQVDESMDVDEETRRPPTSMGPRPDERPEDIMVPMYGVAPTGAELN